jgi:hypothetical protein
MVCLFSTLKQNPYSFWCCYLEGSLRERVEGRYAQLKKDHEVSIERYDIGNKKISKLRSIICDFPASLSK